MTQAYGHSHDAQYIVLTRCTAAQLRSVLNIALSSRHQTAIEYLMGHLGKLVPLPKAPVNQRPGRCDPSVLDANYPPQPTVGQRPLGGGGGGWEGALGGVPGGSPRRAVPRGP